MLKRKDQIVTTLTRGVDALLQEEQGHPLLGLARIEGSGRVIVQNEKGPIELKAKHILIATGSKPATLPGIEFDGNLIGTSTEALSIPEVPKHLVVIGAGYIGLELGSVWNRLGAKVTVLEFLDRILPGMDSEIAAEAKKALRKAGPRISAEEQSHQREGGKRPMQGRMRRQRTDHLRPRPSSPLAARQTPTTLGLEGVRIELHKKGFIPVNERFATTVNGIYAIGDVIPGPMLAHKAEEEAVACVERLVTGHGHVNYDTMPVSFIRSQKLLRLAKLRTN